VLLDGTVTVMSNRLLLNVIWAEEAAT